MNFFHTLFVKISVVTGSILIALGFATAPVSVEVPIQATSTVEIAESTTTVADLIPQETIESVQYVPVVQITTATSEINQVESLPVITQVETPVSSVQPVIQIIVQQPEVQEQVSQQATSTMDIVKTYTVNNSQKGFSNPAMTEQELRTLMSSLDEHIAWKKSAKNATIEIVISALKSNGYVITENEI
jgi:hypothetical protein